MRTETLFFLKEDFQDLVANVSTIAMELIHQTTRRLRSANMLVGDMVFYDVPGRVAKAPAGGRPQRSPG